jgi:hypothetical protein
VNEQGSTIRDAWDGTNLRFSFRRSVDRRVLCLWYEFHEIGSSIVFLDDLIQLFGNLTLLGNTRLNLFML